MPYTPKHDYRSKDALERGDSDKKVMGRELSEDFEAISADLKGIHQELTNEHGEIGDIHIEVDANTESIKEINLEIDVIKEDIEELEDSIVWTQGEVDPVTGLGGEIKPKRNNEVQAQAFAGDGSKLTGIMLDQLADVNADPKTNTRDDLLIWNGTNWVADDFAFIQTALRFKGALAPTANAPATPEGGDLYVFNGDGTLNASWGALSGVVVTTGKFVGYAADTHNRWYLLGNMADTGVMEVSPGTGIDVDDSKPSEPVVSIDRTEVDTWYADKQDTEDRFIDVETNITQIEGDITNIEGDISGLEGDLKQEITDRQDGDASLQDQIDDLKALEGNDVSGLQSQITQNKTDISKNAGDISALKNDFENHDHALNDLSDVNAASPTRDDLIIWNGSNWVADDFSFIQTALRFKGGIAPTAAAPANPEAGDLYVFDSNGTVSASWGVIAGREVQAGKFVGYAAGSHNRWFLLGDMASIGVTDISSGVGISVDDSKPSEPVVSVDRTETDKWYADKGHNHSGVYEPVISPKNTAFNKNFAGSGSANTVSRSDHTHSQYLTSFTETDPTVPTHVKGITQAEINKWNAASSGTAPVTSVNSKTGAVVLSATDVGAEPAFTKNSGFNKSFGTSSGTVAQGDHTHSQYLTSFTETDPTVPPHVKGITQADINKWNTASGSTAPVTSVNSKTGAVVLSAADVGAEPAFTKNSAFNKSFSGSGSADTVSRSDHIHAVINGGTY